MGPAGLLVFILLLLLIFGREAISLYTDWLWFEEVGYSRVFTTILGYKLGLGLVAGGAFALLIYTSVKTAARLDRARIFFQDDLIELPPPELLDRSLHRALMPAALLLVLLIAPQAASGWESFALFLNPVVFDLADPQFGLDIGFFVFRLPALRRLYVFLMAALGLALAAATALYVFYRGIGYGARGLRISPRARAHLWLLIGLLLLVRGGGYLLDCYDLLYSTRGTAFGASYTDVYAVLPALRILASMAFLAGIFMLARIRGSGFRGELIAAGALVVVHAAGLNLYPSLIQRFRVVPNEVESERPFIERTIKFTRIAYGLDKIENQDFPAEESLTAADLKRNEATIKNIRLWEHGPLLATYAQLQEIRTYYKFVDVDNDRYLIDGTYRQIMLSARELSHQHLPSRIWINEHLTYTHGYGVVFGPVNQVTPEGLPEFFIKDIPPVSTVSLKVTRPEIYYGELANDYVFVKTGARELDYPAGDQNIYTNYEGSGGVPIRSWWRKLLFSARYATLRIALSEDITAESRILYHRQIHERVKKIAPFILFDRDAYLVIAQGGRLFWIIDGYTHSDRYPYSEPVQRRGLNYIRNSVKVVIDAYNGSVAFYLSDPADPVVRAYGRIFPGLFRPLNAMPEDLRAHIRYPQDLFAIQARLYATYHMQDPQVFYNKEDLLSIPRRSAANGEREMEPYYTIMRLPGESREEFVLLLPFTPNKRDNMRAWLAARSDPPHYGKLIALDFPKAKLVYGPKQIDARIDQDAFISQQLSLWGQRGSQVIRGSLLAIPIEKSLLYVQPLYLAAEKGSLPELKRVIVAFGNQIAMEETLEQSLRRIFGGKGAREPAERAPSVEGAAAADKDLARRALEHFTRSQEYLRQGQWTAYGEELKRLESVLREMQKGR
ncbi:MAG TPA: UPF0182 family protein [candidate division Zixibacteria bacterium]|nr:UPF0182 family protein [candidate division Zixibacteria bacterium]